MRTTDVLNELKRLPMRRSAVSHVLVVLDDPSASARDVATALQADPGLAARVLQLANSAYFGLSGKIGSVDRAVVTLGAAMTRSLAVSTAAGMFGDRPEDMPDGFWEHSVAVAAGASVVGRMTGIAAGDAICAGLLHDLGAALLYRYDTEGCTDRIATVDTDALLVSEHEAYGGDHAAIGAFALDAWKLPVSIVEALRQHHTDPLDVGEPLARVVIAGEALARAAFDDPPFAHEPACDPAHALAACRLPNASVEQLLERTAEETEHLEGLLSVK